MQISEHWKLKRHTKIPISRVDDPLNKSWIRTFSGGVTRISTPRVLKHGHETLIGEGSFSHLFVIPIVCSQYTIASFAHLDAIGNSKLEQNVIICHFLCFSDIRFVIIQPLGPMLSMECS
jgi:hypothetical protein